MLNLTEEQKELFKQDSIRKELIIRFQDDVYRQIENRNILSESMVLTEILCDEEQLRFGAINSSQFEVSLAEITSEIKNMEINVYLACQDIEIPLGIFVITNVQKLQDKPYRKVTAMDRVYYLDTDVTEWYRSLTFPMTIKAMRDSLFEYLGLEQEVIELEFDTITVDDYFVDSEVNGKQLMEAICEINGRFGGFNRYGVFVYRKLESGGLYPSEEMYPSEGLYPSEVVGGTSLNHVPSILRSNPFCEDYIVQQIDGVILSNNEKTYKTGGENNPYVINNNFILAEKSQSELEDIATRLYSLIGSVSYRPATINLMGQPYIEVGDVVTYRGRIDNLDTYVLKRVMRGTQALKDEFSSKGNEYRENDMNGIMSQLTNINKKTDKLKISLKETNNGLVAEIRRAEQAETDILASLELKVDTDDPEQIVSMLNASADIIRLTGNRVIIESDNFTLSEKGRVVAKSGEIAGWEIDDTGMYKILPTNIPTIPNWTYGLFAPSSLTDDVLVAGQCRLTADAMMYGLYYLEVLSNISCKNIITCASLSVSGTKNRVVKDTKYGDIYMNAYETPSALFGDYGSGEIEKFGFCTIYIDPVFIETVNLEHEYQVFITQTSKAKVEYVEKHKDYFIVHGENGATFDYNIVAKQRGFENNRFFKEENNDGE